MFLSDRNSLKYTIYKKCFIKIFLLGKTKQKYFKKNQIEKNIVSKKIYIKKIPIQNSLKKLKDTRVRVLHFR